MASCFAYTVFEELIFAARRLRLKKTEYFQDHALEHTLATLFMIVLVKVEDYEQNRQN